MFFFENLTLVFPIFSLIFSLILITGLYFLGEIIFYNRKINFLVSSVSKLKYQKILIASNLVMLAIFPIILFLDFSRLILNLISVTIFILGFIKIFFIFKKKNKTINYYFNRSINNYLFLFFLIGLFLINFSPVNHIDSLDYHLWGAKYIFETGKLPNSLESFTNLLVSSGEALYSLGFFFGAEQFGNFIQFSGVLSLVGIFDKFSKKKYFLLLLILSSPMIIFLVSSPKPQFFHLCSNAFLFSLLFINFQKLKENNYDPLSIVVLTNIYLINSINSKFSFILSSFIIYILLVLLSFKKKFFIKMFFLNLIFISFFYLGFVYWKYLTWGGDIIFYLINPLPIHIDGVKLFYEYLINYNNLSKGGSDLIQLFLPLKIGQYSEAIGIGILVFVFFFIKKNRSFFYFIPIFLFFTLINYFFGQASSRFYFEIYVWMVLLLASTSNLKINKKVQFIFYPQFFLTLFAIWYGVFTMSYGVLSADLRDKVMNNTANGYALFKWSDKVLKNENFRILSLHRATGLSDNTLATSFQNFLIIPPDNVQEVHIKSYLRDLNTPTYLLSFYNKADYGIFSKCIDYLYLTEKNIGRHVGRNPFNKGGSYDGYLFKLKNFNESNCLN